MDIISNSAMGCSKSCLILTCRPPQETVPPVKKFEKCDVMLNEFSTDVKKNMQAVSSIPWDNASR